MAYDRNDDFRSRYDRDRDAARDYGAGRDDRDFGGRDDRNFRIGGTGYGDRDYRPTNEGGRETYGRDRDYYGGRQQDHGQRSYGQQNFGQGYAGDRSRDAGRGDYGRQPQGYDYQDRGFVARAGDEVRSWFGDEDAERRREYDQRFDEHGGAGRDASYGRDADYHSWRKNQIDALDRDYHEYRQENAKKFESEFGSWRTNRQTQRQSLTSVKEHMDVVGSDGAHVGTVDKISGDRIILTKNDADAGGRHHSIPSGWIQSVDDKVTISRTAEDAQRQWKDEERSGALFGEDSRSDQNDRTNLNRSFSGTY